MRFVIKLALAAILTAPTITWAENKPVNISPAMAAATVQTEAGPVDISRAQDNQNLIHPDWAKTSRACPPFCVQPMAPADDVTTIGELEIIEMLQDPDAMVVDSRTARWYYDGTIPGAYHIPFAEAVDRLNEVGCEIDFDGWVCEEAKTVALFCNGPWCGQSPTAIRAMISAGFPAEKIRYYRGGMQVWRILGMTVIKPKDE